MRYLFLIMLLSSCKYSTRSANIQTLPEPVTNNAVALVSYNNGVELYSFNGLSEGKSWKDIHNKSFRWKNGEWSTIPSAPDAKPVLASTAVSIDSKVFLIGGYTVAEDHTEVSTPEIFVYDALSGSWNLETLMPTPVDDTVALVYKNRYIYLVSGWHDKDNVSLVQVYDTLTKTWENASEYPAPAVFGHAGGLLNDKLLICDGVKVVTFEDKPREFHSSPVCMLGEIDPQDHTVIKWKETDHHSGVGLYRMASTDDQVSRIVFAGGSDNPYNYDGVGYNKIPSQASSKVFSFDLENHSWHQSEVQIQANMDHRSLLFDGEYFYILGGMLNSQIVTNQTIRFKYD